MDGHPHCNSFLILSIKVYKFYLSFLFSYGIYHYHVCALVVKSISGFDQSFKRLVYVLIEDLGLHQEACFGIVRVRYYLCSLRM